MQRVKQHPRIREIARRRQAHRLRRARADRRRVAVGPQAGVPRRRTGGLCGRLHERAAHQGQPQRDSDRNDGGGRGRRGAGSRAGRAMCSTATKKPCRQFRSHKDLKRVRNVKPLWSKLRHHCRRSARRRSKCGQTSYSDSRLFGTLQTRQAGRCHPEAGVESQARSFIPSRTGSSASTSFPACSCPTPTTRKTSRFT